MNDGSQHEKLLQEINNVYFKLDHLFFYINEVDMDELKMKLLEFQLKQLNYQIDRVLKQAQEVTE